VPLFSAAAFFGGSGLGGFTAAVLATFSGSAACTSKIL